MKFKFEGLNYEDTIEIDFDFLGKSEFISALEPDLSTPILIIKNFPDIKLKYLKDF